jgi:prepilin-type N-terminal cleavage/methylation domain-containing protein
MKRAFTLIEVMIVIAIIAILVSIAVPNIKKARQQSQNQTATVQAPPPDLRTQPVPGYTQIGTKTINVGGVDVQAQIVQNVAGDKFYLYTNNGVPTFLTISD